MTRSRPVLARASVLFGIMFAHALLETARDALFLTRLGPERLAWAYLAIAGTALVAVTVARRWGLRDARRMLITFLTFALVGTSILAVSITLAREVVFVLYVWTGLVATLVVPCFWALVDRTLHVTEAKRVFGAIGAGGVLGAMGGSALAGVLGRLVPAHQLVTAGAVAFAGALALAIGVMPHPSIEEVVPIKRKAQVVSRASHRYLRFLIVAGIASTMTLTLGDIVFKRVIAERLPAEDLATVFGAIYTALNFVSLIIQLVVTPRLLAHRGVGAALVVLPTLFVTTALGFAITGAIAAIVALKLADGGLRHSLHRAGSEILFLPLPTSLRDAMKPIADALSQRGGQALAALTIFAFASIGASAQLLAGVAATLAVVWLVALVAVRRAYLTQFRTMLRAGEINRDARVGDLDSDALELLVKAVGDAHVSETRARLEALAATDLDAAIELLADPHVRGEVRRVLVAVGPRALDHLVAALDDRRVRLEVRRHLPRTISRFAVPRAVSALVARLPREPDGVTEFKILRALGRLRADHPELPVDSRPLRAYVQRSIADASRYATWLERVDAETAPLSLGGQLIRELLADKRRWAFEHAFRALHILQPTEGLRSVHDALLDHDEARKSAAREILEVVAPADVRAPLLALAERMTGHAPPPARHPPAAPATYEELLVALLTDHSESLKCIAAHEIADRGLTQLRPALTRLRPLAARPLVKHAFDEAIERLCA